MTYKYGSDTIPARLKVPELREALRERGLAVDGLKAVLVQRLEDALRKTVAQNGETASAAPILSPKAAPAPTPAPAPAPAPAKAPPPVDTTQLAKSAASPRSKSAKTPAKALEPAAPLNLSEPAPAPPPPAAPVKAPEVPAPAPVPPKKPEAAAAPPSKEPAAARSKEPEPAPAPSKAPSPPPPPKADPPPPAKPPSPPLKEAESAPAPEPAAPEPKDASPAPEPEPEDEVLDETEALLQSTLPGADSTESPSEPMQVEDEAELNSRSKPTQNSKGDNLQRQLAKRLAESDLANEIVKKRKDKASLPPFDMRSLPTFQQAPTPTNTPTAATPLDGKRQRRWGTSSFGKSDAAPSPVSSDSIANIVTSRSGEFKEPAVPPRASPSLPPAAEDAAAATDTKPADKSEVAPEPSSASAEADVDGAASSDKKASERRTSKDGGRAKKASSAPGRARIEASIENEKDEEPQQREVPPPKRPPTNTLCIRNFVRPFTIPAVTELLAQTGKTTRFWMDSIKTHCYVTYETEEEAIATRDAVHNLTWPKGGRKLAAEFVEHDEATRVIEGSGAPPAKGLPGAPAGPSPVTNAAAASAAAALAAAARSARPPPPPPQKQEAPPLTLDDLFRKTVCKPHIYYLALTETEVAIKLREKEKKDAAANTAVANNVVAATDAPAEV